MRPDRPPLVRNAADPHQVRRGRRVEAQREAQYLAALGVVLKSREGRFVVWDLLQRAGLYRTSLQPDPHQTYALEGRRNFGLELLEAVQVADAEKYLLMEREARARQDHEDRATLAVQTPPVAALTAEESLSDA
jgi:hypothetical protein